MNVFKTGPRFIKGYIETKRYTSIKKQILKLREAGDIEGEKELIRVSQKRWVEALTKILGLTYEVYGEENIPAPEDGPFMIYSNHQSFADICATLWLMKDHGMMGYVSKEEWRKYPILADVVDCSRSIFLVRHNPREAVKTLSEAKKNLDLGFNLLAILTGGLFGLLLGKFEALGQCHVLAVNVLEQDVVGHLLAELVILKAAVLDERADVVPVLLVLFLLSLAHAGKLVCDLLRDIITDLIDKSVILKRRS